MAEQEERVTTEGTEGNEGYSDLVTDALEDLDTAFGLPGYYKYRWNLSESLTTPVGIKSTDKKDQKYYVTSLAKSYEQGIPFTTSQKLAFGGQSEVLSQIGQSAFSGITDDTQRNSAYDFMMDKLAFHFEMDRSGLTQSIVSNDEDFTGGDPDEFLRSALLTKPSGVQTATLRDPNYGTGLFGGDR